MLIDVAAEITKSNLTFLALGAILGGVLMISLRAPLTTSPPGGCTMSANYEYQLSRAETLAATAEVLPLSTRHAAP